MVSILPRLMPTSLHQYTPGRGVLHKLYITCRGPGHKRGRRAYMHLARTAGSSFGLAGSRSARHELGDLGLSSDTTRRKNELCSSRPEARFPLTTEVGKWPGLPRAVYISIKTFALPGCRETMGRVICGDRVQAGRVSGAARWETEEGGRPYGSFG